MIKVSGTPSSQGLAMGEIVEISRRYSGLNRVVLDTHREHALFEAAQILAKDELELLAEKSTGDEHDIFIFQRTMLDDNGLLTEIRNYISAGAGAAAAVERASKIFEHKMEILEDEYFQQRAVDIKDVCRRIVDILDGRQSQRLVLKRPSIIASDEIMPSDLADAPREMILGFITAKGSCQSHASIIARTMGIPAIVLAGDEFLHMCNGKFGAIDGADGELFIEPDESTKARFQHRISLEKRRTVTLEKLKNMQCITKDGTKIQLLANCSSPEDIKAAIEQGADGIGLLRSEFIFMGTRLPCENEQYEFYVKCLNAAQGKAVTIRTFDIGADKAVEGLTAISEPNPAMGLRGLRLSLSRRDILKCQLKALLRAGVNKKLKVMFPMVATPNDVISAMEIVNECKDELAASGIGYSRDVKWGIMIETPAAALLSDELCKMADFFSIGTNDLTQYTHAVDRMNPLVEKYYKPNSAAVKKLIQFTVKNASSAGIPVTVCGESAANAEIAAEYARLGVKGLSMVPRAINAVKEALLETTL